MAPSPLRTGPRRSTFLASIVLFSSALILASCAQDPATEATAPVDAATTPVGTTAAALEAVVAPAPVAPSAQAAPSLVSINGGAAWTKARAVTLTLTPPTGAKKYCISLKTDPCTRLVALPRTNSAPTTLDKTEGTQTVYVTFDDAAKTVASASIGLDTKTPSEAIVTVSRLDQSVELQFAPPDDVGSGFDKAIVSLAEKVAPATCLKPTSGCTVTNGTPTKILCSGLTNGKAYGARICTMDKAGNTSKGIPTAPFKPAPHTVGPTGVLTTPPGTKVPTVDLEFSATGHQGARIVSYALGMLPESGSRKWTAFKAPGAAIESFKVSKWAVKPGAGVKTVGVWFRDEFDNESATPATAVVVLDPAAPAVAKTASIAVTPANSGVVIVPSGFSDNNLTGFVVRAKEGKVAPASCTIGTELTCAFRKGTVSCGGLTNGTTYALRVCARDIAGNLSASKTGSVVPSATACAPSCIGNGGTCTANGTCSTCGDWRVTADGKGCEEKPKTPPCDATCAAHGGTCTDGVCSGCGNWQVTADGRGCEEKPCDVTCAIGGGTCSNGDCANCAPGFTSTGPGCVIDRCYQNNCGGHGTCVSNACTCERGWAPTVDGLGCEKICPNKEDGTQCAADSVCSQGECQVICRSDDNRLMTEWRVGSPNFYATDAQLSLLFKHRCQAGVLSECPVGQLWMDDGTGPSCQPLVRLLTDGVFDKTGPAACPTQFTGATVYERCARGYTKSNGSLVRCPEGTYAQSAGTCAPIADNAPCFTNEQMDEWYYTPFRSLDSSAGMWSASSSKCVRCGADAGFDTSIGACRCNQGMSGNGFSCSQCSSYAYYTNQSPVGQECRCYSGYYGNGVQCDYCPSNAWCDGSITPSCNDGRVWNGSSCACPSGTIEDGTSMNACISCQGMSNYVIVNEKCVYCDTTQSGYSADSTGCHYCDPTYTVWDSSSQSCVSKCGYNQYATSWGSCEYCDTASGMYRWENNSCQYIYNYGGSCGGGQSWDSSTNSCVCSGGSNYYYDGSNCQYCDTSSGQYRWENNSCQYNGYTGPSCNGSAWWDSATNSCQCGSDSFYDGMGCQSCNVSSGQYRWENNSCQYNGNTGGSCNGNAWWDSSTSSCVCYESNNYYDGSSCVYCDTSSSQYSWMGSYCQMNY